jgi:HEPN domain-containing protein
MRIHEIAEWLLIADEDTVSAEILNKENILANSYYHCSQAVEKYLKSYLISNDIIFIQL